LLIGTASWTDKTLIACGRFYSQQANSAETRLRYCASQFPIVEVDSSCHAVSSASFAQLWGERRPEGFVMHVRAFRLFTGHPTLPAALPGDIQTALAERRGKNLYYNDTADETRDELGRPSRDAP